MRLEIDDALRLTCGVATRSRLLTVVSRHQLVYEVRSGKLVAAFPRALCRPWDVALLRERAALTSVGPPAALSHLSALRRWELLQNEAAAAVHVCAPASRPPRTPTVLLIHRLAVIPL